ncbi:hypothetical protein TNCV_4021151 [Trichonephila clavipes]|nr:hypothetical protein TNCV_4021151 [Trichonephila clavipes]
MTKTTSELMPHLTNFHIKSQERFPRPDRFNEQEPPIGLRWNHQIHKFDSNIANHKARGFNPLGYLRSNRLANQNSVWNVHFDVIPCDRSLCHLVCVAF